MTKVGKIRLQGLLNREPPHRQNRHKTNRRERTNGKRLTQKKNYKRIIGEKATSEATVENREEKKTFFFFLHFSQDEKKTIFQKKNRVMNPKPCKPNKERRERERERERDSS